MVSFWESSSKVCKQPFFRASPKTHRKFPPRGKFLSRDKDFDRLTLKLRSLTGRTHRKTERSKNGKSSLTAFIKFRSSLFKGLRGVGRRPAFLVVARRRRIPFLIVGEDIILPFFPLKNIISGWWLRPSVYKPRLRGAGAACCPHPASLFFACFHKKIVYFDKEEKSGLSALICGKVCGNCAKPYFTSLFWGL